MARASMIVDEVKRAVALEKTQVATPSSSTRPVVGTSSGTFCGWLLEAIFAGVSNSSHFKGQFEAKWNNPLAAQPAAT